MEDLIHGFLKFYTYPEVYGLTVLYFLFLYFVVGWCFEKACQLFEKAGHAERINVGLLPAQQRKREITNSLISIMVFGFSSWPIVYLYRIEFFSMVENTSWNVLLGLVLLNIWNEIHFFLVHRFMHLPFFMRHVHRVHHLSKVPSVWSVYSFHWLEALLLSTVPLTLSFIYPLAPLAIALYPLNSVLFNFSGHCNYRIIALKNTWLGMASRHVLHHQKGTVSFGFVSGLLDRMFDKRLKQ
jgi:Delta7-sterol 5-desaturase